MTDQTRGEEEEKEESRSAPNARPQERAATEYYLSFDDHKCLVRCSPPPSKAITINIHTALLGTCIT